MKCATTSILGILMTTIFVFSACQRNIAENTKIASENALTSNSSASKPTIEEFDFKNFTYSYPYRSSEITFTLTDGEKPLGKLDETGFTLIKVEYADLTNDGTNEAVINLLVHKAVSTANLIQVYTIDKNKPKSLWTFWTGNEAKESGLKRIYAQSGELIVELFGKNKFENDELKFNLAKVNSNARPTVYTKVHFKWNSKKFAIEGKPELFNYNWKNEMEKNQ